MFNEIYQFSLFELIKIVCKYACDVNIRLYIEALQKVAFVYFQFIYFVYRYFDSALLSFTFAFCRYLFFVRCPTADTFDNWRLTIRNIIRCRRLFNYFPVQLKNKKENMEDTHEHYIWSYDDTCTRMFDRLRIVFKTGVSVFFFIFLSSVCRGAFDKRFVFQQNTFALAPRRWANDILQNKEKLKKKRLLGNWRSTTIALLLHSIANTYEYMWCGRTTRYARINGLIHNL